MNLNPNSINAIKNLGAILLVLGLILSFSALTMDISVSLGGLGGRVVNLGRMQEQATTLMAGLVLTVVGIALYVTALLVTPSDKIRKCPHCGNPVQLGFPICSSCRFDISWVKGYPCIPGAEDELQVLLDQQSLDNRINLLRGRIQSFYTGMLLEIPIAFVGIVAVISNNSIRQKNVVITLVSLLAITVFCMLIYCVVFTKAKIREIELRKKRQGSSNDRLSNVSTSPSIFDDETAASEIFSKANTLLCDGQVNAACEQLQQIVTKYPNASIRPHCEEVMNRECTAFEIYVRGKGLYEENRFDEAIGQLKSIDQGFPATQGWLMASEIINAETEAMAIYDDAVRLNKAGDVNGTIAILKSLNEKYPNTKFGKKASIALAKSKA